MWARGPDPERTRQLAERLLELAPPPSETRVEESLDLSASPERVAVELDAHRRPGSAWLDGGRQRVHRIAVDPLLTVSTRGRRTRVRAGERTLELDCGGFEILAALERAHGDASGRLFGYLGYELGHELERLGEPASRDVDVPDLWLCLHDAWLESRDGAWTLVTAGRERRDAWVRRLAGLRGAHAAEPSVGDSGLPRAAAVRCRPDAAAYRAAVERTVRRIPAGEIFQTNLCRRFEVAMEDSSAWSLYRRMRAVGDASHGGWVRTDGGAVLSRSPESFLELHDGTVESRPIKGTRPRGRDPEEDRALRQELATSEKDRAELAMIVDLVRNDLGRVCVAGSVEVAEHARILDLPGLWHTVSRVRGRLRQDAGGVGLLRAAFPAGSITGAPKIQAMIVAAGEEPFRRGPAMGSVGWIDPGGDLELSVAIRTAVVAGGRVVYHAGCGIVADSDPEHEEQESLVKARPFLAALAP